MARNMKDNFQMECNLATEFISSHLEILFTDTNTKEEFTMESFTDKEHFISKQYHE